MRPISVSVSFLLVFVLMGCATGLGNPTKSEVDQANQICTDQILADRKAEMRNSFSRWLFCKEEHFMPLEIRQYPDREAAIREMYNKLKPMAWAVDMGSIKVEAVYDQWDKMMSELGTNSQVCVKRSDGSQNCIAKNGALIFMESKDGNIVPIK